jgi:hypothetical protein
MKTAVHLNYICRFVSSFIYLKLTETLLKFNFLTRYWYLNELIWQEGLLIDFLQKKICDNWIKRFLIYSAYLFNERFVFEKIIKMWLDIIIIPLHKFSTFDLNNVAMLFYYIFIFFFVIFYVIFFLVIFFLMF